MLALSSLDLWTKDPLVKTTVAKATRRKVLLVTFTSDIFLRKTQKLLSVLPSVAYLWMLRGLWMKFKKKSQEKSTAFAVRFSWLPFLDLNQRPPWLDATHQILLARLTTVICFANRKSLQSEQLSVAWMLLDEDIWFDSRKEIKTKNRGKCLGFFVLAPLFGLEPKTPWLTVRCSNQLS